MRCSDEAGRGWPGAERHVSHCVVVTRLAVAGLVLSVTCLIVLQ